jgi:hypothetical protein
MVSKDTSILPIDTLSKAAQPMEWVQRAESQNPSTLKTNQNSLELIGKVYGALLVTAFIGAFMFPRIRAYFQGCLSFRRPRPMAKLSKEVEDVFAEFQSNNQLQEAKNSIIQVLTNNKLKSHQLAAALDAIGQRPAKESLHMLRVMDGISYLEMDAPMIRFLEEFILNSITHSALLDFDSSGKKLELKQSLIGKHKMELWINTKFKGAPKELREDLHKLFTAKTLDIALLQRLINMAEVDYDISTNELLISMDGISWEEMSDDMAHHIISTIKQIFSNYSKAYQRL